MVKIGDTLKSFRAAAGLSQPDVAALLGGLGFPIHPSSISRWEKGLTLPNVEQFLALCEIYDIFDLTKFGVKPRLNSLGLQRLREYDSLLRGDGRFAAKGRAVVRLYNLPASAGTGSYTDSDDYEEIEVDEEEIPSGTDFAVRVSGDSMEPDFHDGQLVFVRGCDRVSVGDTGIFSVNGDTFIKRLGRGALFSLNPKYAPIAIGEYDSVRTFGRVIG